MARKQQVRKSYRGVTFSVNQNGTFRFQSCANCAYRTCLENSFTSIEDIHAAIDKHKETHFATLMQIFGQQPKTWKMAEPAKTLDHSLVQTRGNRRMKASGNG